MPSLLVRHLHTGTEHNQESNGTCDGGAPVECWTPSGWCCTIHTHQSVICQPRCPTDMTLFQQMNEVRQSLCGGECLSVGRMSRLHPRKHDLREGMHTTFSFSEVCTQQQYRSYTPADTSKRPQHTHTHTHTHTHVHATLYATLCIHRPGLPALSIRP